MESALRNAVSIGRLGSKLPHTAAPSFAAVSLMHGRGNQNATLGSLSSVFRKKNVQQGVKIGSREQCHLATRFPTKPPSAATAPPGLTAALSPRVFNVSAAHLISRDHSMQACRHPIRSH
ncbi:hypothetical protein ACLOJK_001009 [Asimina triloba]